MKRSFSALFVLLTALSGPLVFTPPAISRQGSAATASADDKAVSRTDADQPPCTFEQPAADEFSDCAAPEDLVVVPEDFGYELYNQGSACEIEQNAALNDGQNDTVGDVPANTGNQVASESGDLERLCLPFAEYGNDLEQWYGPAIAGPEKQPFDEELECELAAEAFHFETEAREATARNDAYEMLLSVVHKKSYVASYWLRASIRDSLVLVVNGLHWAENASAAQVEKLTWSTGEFAAFGWQLASKITLPKLEMVAAKEVIEVDTTLPTPPFCDCWAAPPPPSAPAEELASEFECDLLLDGGALELDRVSEIVEGIQPSFETSDLDVMAADSAEIDAIPPQEPTAPQTESSAAMIDLDGLKQAASDLWNEAVERVELLERWSKEYEFEPSRENKLRFVYP